MTFYLKYRWICIGTALLEVVISWKFRHGAGNIVDAQWPLYVLIPWLTVIIVCFTFYVYLRFKPGHTTIYGDKKSNKKNKQVSNNEKELALEDRDSQPQKNIKSDVKNKNSSKVKKK